MIVRLMTEAQYRVDDGLRDELNRLDGEAAAALAAGDADGVDRILGEMSDLVRSRGELLPAEDLSPSDAVIPPSDLSLDEMRELFEGEGLIPDLPVA